MTGDYVLFKNWYLLRVKNIPNHPHKARTWYLLGVLLQAAHPFYMGVPPAEQQGL